MKHLQVSFSLAVAGGVCVTPGCAGVGGRAVATDADVWSADQATLLRFERVLPLESTSEKSANVSIGDLNGDGSPDIVLAKGRHWPLRSRVLLNDGNGRFPTAHDLSDTAARSYSGKLVDIDNDGDLDVVVSNDRPDHKLVYLNDGHAQFRRGSEYGDPRWSTRNVEVADLNGDRFLDIVVANRESDDKGANFVCLNRGEGKFNADCNAFSREPATTISAADFNGDGFVDLAVPHREGGQSHIYLNDGHAVFEHKVPFGPPDAQFRMALPADMNGDGLVDLVAIDEHRGTFVFFKDRWGEFPTAFRVGGDDASSYALALGDLNHDGKTDVVVGRDEAPSTVYFNDGSGISYAPVPFGDGKGTVYGLAIGDIDKDGSMDIAAARSDAPNIVYFGSPPQP